jgi:predicted dehydrogenase
MLDWDAWCGPSGPAEFDTEVYHRWRRYKRYSTGIIGDLLVHMMTPMVNAVDAGWPVRVTATGGHYIDKAMENHDQVNLTVQFEKEHTLVVAGSTCNEQGLETMIRGHQANLYLGSNNCVLRPERLFADDIDEQTIQCDEVEPQDELRVDWLRSIRTRNLNASPVELGAKIMVIVELATRSMWEGSAFTFDPATLTASRA